MSTPEFMGTAQDEAAPAAEPSRLDLSPLNVEMPPEEPLPISEVFDTPEVLRERTPVEASGHELLDHIARLQDELEGVGGSLESHLLALAEDFRDKLIHEEAARIATPPLLEVTGNISESELAARMMEEKAKGATAIGLKHVNMRETYDIIAHTYRASAQDFRSGLHLPQTVVDGRVIPYNETNDTGLRHEQPLRVFFTDVYARNLKAGWWTDLATGQPKKRNMGELLMLFVTEIVEAYDAFRDNAPDDKLPQFPGVGVELGDLAGALAAGVVAGPSADPKANPGERLFRKVRKIAHKYEAIRKTPEAVGPPETADAIPAMDVAQMIDAKLDFNANRADHKLENRLKDDGKKT